MGCGREKDEPKVTVRAGAANWEMVMLFTEERNGGGADLKGGKDQPFSVDMLSWRCSATAEWEEKQTVVRVRQHWRCTSARHQHTHRT